MKTSNCNPEVLRVSADINTDEWTGQQFHVTELRSREGAWLGGQQLLLRHAV